MLKLYGLNAISARGQGTRTLHDRSRSPPEAASLPPTEAGSAREAAARQAKARLSPRRRPERVGAEVVRGEDFSVARNPSVVAPASAESRSPPEGRSRTDLPRVKSVWRHRPALSRPGVSLHCRAVWGTRSVSRRPSATIPGSQRELFGICGQKIEGTRRIMVLFQSLVPGEARRPISACPTTRNASPSAPPRVGQVDLRMSTCGSRREAGPRRWPILARGRARPALSSHLPLTQNQWLR